MKVILFLLSALALALPLACGDDDDDDDNMTDLEKFCYAIAECGQMGGEDDSMLDECLNRDISGDSHESSIQLCAVECYQQNPFIGCDSYLEWDENYFSACYEECFQP